MLRHIIYCLDVILAHTLERPVMGHIVEDEHAVHVSEVDLVQRVELLRARSVPQVDNDVLVLVDYVPGEKIKLSYFGGMLNKGFQPSFF